MVVLWIKTLLFLLTVNFYLYLWKADAMDQVQGWSHFQKLFRQQPIAGTDWTQSNFIPIVVMYNSYKKHKYLYTHQYGLLSFLQNTYDVYFFCFPNNALCKFFSYIKRSIFQCDHLSTSGFTSCAKQVFSQLNTSN